MAVYRVPFSVTYCGHMNARKSDLEWMKKIITNIEKQYRSYSEIAPTLDKFRVYS